MAYGIPSGALLLTSRAVPFAAPDTTSDPASTHTTSPSAVVGTCMLMRMAPSPPKFRTFCARTIPLRRSRWTSCRPCEQTAAAWVTREQARHAECPHTAGAVHAAACEAQQPHAWHRPRPPVPVPGRPGLPGAAPAATPKHSLVSAPAESPSGAPSECGTMTDQWTPATTGRRPWHSNPARSTSSDPAACELSEMIMGLAQRARLHRGTWPPACMARARMSGRVPCITAR